MTLQTSGAISLNDLANEFGGNTPHAINEYYRGGGLVPDTATNSGIPTSGQVDLNDFYGGDVVSGPPSGTMWTWGHNGDFLSKFTTGSLGRNQTATNTETSAAQITGGGSNWTTVTQNHEFTPSSVKADGRMWTWGLNDSGQLGQNWSNGNQSSTSSPNQVLGSRTDWKQGNGAIAHGAAIRTDGRLWTWGQDGQGALGQNRNPPLNQSSPQQTAAGGTNWAQISKSQVCGVAIKTDGRLWTWGNNSNGMLGDGTTTNRYSPVQTVGSATNWQSDTSGVRVACANQSNHSAAIRTDGRLWTWGRTAIGKLGNNQNSLSNNKSSPIQTVATATNWKAVWCEAFGTQAVRTDGRLWSWGEFEGGWGGVNSYIYNSGSGKAFYTSYSSPVQMTAGGTSWTEKHVFGFNSIANVKTDGRLWAWGNNGNGANGWTFIGTQNGEREWWSPNQTVAGGTNWLGVGGVNYAKTGIRS